MIDGLIPAKTPQLVEKFKKTFQENGGLLLIHLCTAEGDLIHSFSDKKIKPYNNKLAKLAHAQWELSDKASHRYFNNTFNLTIIENEMGCLLLANAYYMNVECMLTVVAKIDVPLAKVRFLIRRLADDIESIEYST